MVTRSSLFIPEKVKKTLRKYQPQFRENLTKLMVRQKVVFYAKKT